MRLTVLTKNKNDINNSLIINNLSNKYKYETKTVKIFQKKEEEDIFYSSNMFSDVFEFRNKISKHRF